VDELERLIQQQRRPSPRQSLDENIAGVLSAAPQPAERQPKKRSRLLALCSIAACTGLLGFILGRVSAPSGDPSAQTHQPRGQPKTVTHSVLKVPVASEQIAEFAVRLPPTEGIFGAIPRNE
jgi:hypothetical protein